MLSLKNLSSLRKFILNIVSCYQEYQLVYERFVESQCHKLQKIVHEIITEGINLYEQFQIDVIIGKLPPSWTDFQKHDSP